MSLSYRRRRTIQLCICKCMLSCARRMKRGWRSCMFCPALVDESCKPTGPPLEYINWSSASKGILFIKAKRVTTDKVNVSHVNCHGEGWNMLFCVISRNALSLQTRNYILCNMYTPHKNRECYLFISFVGGDRAVQAGVDEIFIQLLAENV